MRKQLQLSLKMLLVVIALSGISYLATAQEYLDANIIPNGGLEDGLWTYRFEITKGGVEGVNANHIHSNDAIEGSKSAQVEILDMSHNSKAKTLLYTDPVAAEAGQYVVSYYIKTDAAAGLDADTRITQFNNGGYNTNFEPTGSILYGTEWQHIRKTGNLNWEALDTVTVKFQLNEEGSYFIDDVKLQKVNSFLNPGFEDADDFMVFWDIDTIQKDGAMATFSQETTDVNAGSSALKIDVTSVSDTARDISLESAYSCFLEPSNGLNRLKFNAKGQSANDSVWVVIKMYKENIAGGEYSLSHSIHDTITLSDQWAEYESGFAVPDTISYVEFRLILGNQVSTILLDDFSVAAYAPVNITSSPVEDAEINTPYSYQLTWEGIGEFSVSSYPEAAWLTIDQNGLLTGTPTEKGEFGVSVILDDGASQATQSFTLTVSDNVSIVANQLDRVKVYPIPTDNELMIENAVDATVRIIDVTGKELINVFNTESLASFDVSVFNPGIYFVSIQRNGESFTQKVFVK
jgi:hypothetical protein